jgi:hypothetical protein
MLYRKIFLFRIHPLSELETYHSLLDSFGYLEPDGNVIFYNKLLAILISEFIDDKLLNELRKIEDLSPGDFKIVRDIFNFHPKKDLNHQILLNALSKESQIKNSYKMKRAIGF